jgi:archaellum component FlaD/FlaE
MVEKEVDRMENNSRDFDLKSELSNLVEKKIITSKIANKLEIKLKEKNVKLTKNQFHALVEKIINAIKNYPKFEQQYTKDDLKQPIRADMKTDEDMQKLIDTIQKLELRITNIETGQKNKKIQSPIMVTQDEITIPGEEQPSIKEWNLNPLVEIPNDPESIIILMKWLQYLIDKCGRSNLSTILDYYVDIGWLSQDAKITLIDYSHGITEENIRSDISKRLINDLPSKDHIQSFLFIQKLKGMNFDKHFIEKIDNEVIRLTKKVDNYRFK